MQSKNLVSNIEFTKEGVKTISEINGLNSSMQMDIVVRKLKAGQELKLVEANKEMAILLLQGSINFIWESSAYEAKRSSVYSENPYCLHVSKKREVVIRALSESEILIQCTENEADFESKLYTPSDINIQLSSIDIWDSTAAREIKTIFDYNNAPYSKMVMGEVISYPGRWSSYIPHYHPQPEVYYYKFDRKQGFGACFIGDEVFKVTDGSFSIINGGYVHPQVSAPGYRMYYCWMIRHLDGNPWTNRIDDEDHKWLLNEK
ncbi:5-deoxy-glucuronate isomerase [Clostridium sp. AL.422]|uniref:5-deoxy-glucuronate isomerase n=1 Tax=Clostridium TaxID=1485 RepID=UPI00293DF9C0|nr:MULTISPECIES: 5-deoxy-glucuronate isomerase [unclassified Clostridium]MDV4152040.1 5-deoxy-glucuronate isomerase [Clostridium sp. AL.422]